MGKRKSLRNKGKEHKSDLTPEYVKEESDQGEQPKITDVSVKLEAIFTEDSDASRLTSSQNAEGTSDNCTDDELHNLAKQASKMARKLNKTPTKKDKLSPAKTPEFTSISDSSENIPNNSGESLKKKRRSIRGMQESPAEGISPRKRAISKLEGDKTIDIGVKKELNGSQSSGSSPKKTPKRQVMKVESTKQVKYDTPDGYSLSSCVEGQLWTEDLEDSELWLVRMPVEFDVKQLEKAEPVAGSSIEVSRFTKDKAPYMVEVLAIQYDPNEGRSYSVLLPSKENKTPECVGSFTGEIQVTSHVITKPYLVDIQNRKKRELPKGLKMRNVPFGAAAPRRPSQADSSQTSLSQDSDSMSKSRKQKKSKKEKLDKDFCENVTENIKKEDIDKNELLDDQDKMETTIDSLTDDLSQESSSRKHKKKKKHKEREREEKELIKLRSEPRLPDDSDDFEASPSKKKRLSMADCSELGKNESGSLETEEHFTKSKKKKKHKRKD